MLYRPDDIVHVTGCGLNLSRWYVQPVSVSNYSPTISNNILCLCISQKSNHDTFLQDENT